jgi:hypothetical protein
MGTGKNLKAERGQAKETKFLSLLLLFQKKVNK